MTDPDQPWTTPSAAPKPLPPEPEAQPEPEPEPEELKRPPGFGLASFLYDVYNRGGSDPNLRNRNYQGKPCPAWSALPRNVQEKWCEVACALQQDSHDTHQASLRAANNAALEELTRFLVSSHWRYRLDPLRFGYTVQLVEDPEPMHLEERLQQLEERLHELAGRVVGRVVDGMEAFVKGYRGPERNRGVFWGLASSLGLGMFAVLGAGALGKRK